MRLLSIKNDCMKNYIVIDKIVRFEILEDNTENKRMYSVHLIDESNYIQPIKLELETRKEAEDIIKKILATIETTRNEIIYI